MSNDFIPIALTVTGVFLLHYMGNDFMLVALTVIGIFLLYCEIRGDD